MKFYISILLLLLFGCQNSRVEQLEKEKVELRAKIDTLESINEKQSQIAQKLRDEAEKAVREIKDGIIVAEN